MPEYVETIIIGGGQAGLATGYWLAHHGREHLILEQAAQPASAWRNGRWDSFTLVTPNWMTRLPWVEDAGSDPDGFMPRDEFVACFDRHVERAKVPIRYNTQVDAVEPDRSRYLIRSGSRTYAADNVVVATGLFQRPRVPAYSRHFPGAVQQLHSGAYRAPELLPPGAVFVVGTGQSGCQIAEELNESGRQVYLCLGSAPTAPRRYRGKDIIWWRVQMGLFDQTVDQLASPAERFGTLPQLTGKNGGHTINPHRLARDGVTLLGRIEGISDGKSRLTADLHETLARIDQGEAAVIRQIDALIAQRGFDFPEEALPQHRDGYAAKPITELDLRERGIATVIWATGYTFNFDFVKAPVLDAVGYPLQEGGVTAQPGLYFVGLPWMPMRKSGFLYGVSENAAYVAAHITARAKPGAA